ncbi:hypothetical protein OS187_01575 [Xanthomonadaceae bacterium JHOS43]|nr:hypothetical protein [Xanthomonadaceae bacterium JHOS43]MCX7563650.1 hypothetical protein [Xanthomonadaceae bacterium XH05]
MSDATTGYADASRVFYRTLTLVHGHVKPIPSRHYLTAVAVALLAIAGIAAIWAGFGLFRRSPCGWMALVAAVDAAVLMKLAGFPAGAVRARIVLAITVMSVLTGGFVVAAVSIGAGFGILPHEAIWRTGPELVYFWWQLNISAWDVVALLLALPLSWWLGR